MQRIIDFEDFAPPDPNRNGQENIGPEALADEKLAAFESGYQSGWNDASSTHADTRAILSGELRDALSRAQLDVNDAKESVLKSLLPILEKTVSIMFEPSACALITRKLMDQVAAQAAAWQGQNIILRCNSEELSALRSIAKEKKLEIDLQSAAHLPPGQVCLETPKAQMMCDLAEVEAAIRGALTEFETLHSEARS